MANKLQMRWVSIVTVFLYITVVWNIIEGSTSIYFGYLGNDISLFAFGIDSWIEVLSASLVLYHMIFKSLPDMKTGVSQSTPLRNNQSKSTLFSLETERKLTLFIGCLLVIFCLFACVGGVFRLIEGIPPSSTRWGIIIGGVCVVAMFVMYYYKTKAAVILNSSTIASDAACSLGCIKLSAVLLVGSILYEISPKLWWLDAVTAIVIGLLVGYEGYETVKTAKDRAKFQGGCGCCGASESGLAKYLRDRFVKQMEQEQTTLGEGDTCCEDAEAVCGGGDCCGDDNDEDINAAVDEDCCASGKCSKNRANSGSYGAVEST